jgi:hypothetical protein
MRTFDNMEFQRRVDEVLFYVWDPIGVSDQPFARGEYESYVPSIVSLVEKTENIQLIAEHLESIVKDYMEFSPDRARCVYTAEILLQHKKAVREGCA